MLAKTFYEKIFRPACQRFFRFTFGIIRRVSSRLLFAIEQILRDASKELHPQPTQVNVDVFGTTFTLNITALTDSMPARIKNKYVDRVKGGAVYEPATVKTLTRLLEQVDNPVFMDVGAYVGFFAFYVAALKNDRVPVYAVESNADYCEGLQRSMTLNGFTNVKVLNAVLSEKTQTARVKDRTVDYRDSDGIEVTTITLDELCERENILPNIIKMDVHGAEGKVLQGMDGLMQESIEYILLELHHNMMLDRYSTGATRAKILSHIRTHKFNIFVLAGHRMRPRVQRQFDVKNLPFTYRLLTKDNESELLFDRPLDVLLLLSKRSNVEAVLGSSADDAIYY